MPIPGFVTRFILGVAINSVVKMIDRYGKEFDAEKAKVYVQEQVKRAVPDSMWGEQAIEDGIIRMTDFVIDKFIKGVLNSSVIVGDVMKKLASQDWEGAALLLRKFVYSQFEGVHNASEFGNKPADVQSVQFAEVVQKSFSLEGASKGGTQADSVGVRVETTEHKLD